MNSTTDTRGTRGIAKLTRGVVALHVLVLLVHMVAAIAFVSGVRNAYVAHRHLAWLVFGCGILQALAVLNPVLPKLHPLYRIFVLLVVVGEILQLFVIPRGQLIYHVSVAMVVWGCALALYVRVLDPDWGTAAIA